MVPQLMKKTKYATYTAKYTVGFLNPGLFTDLPSNDLVGKNDVFKYVSMLIHNSFFFFNKQVHTILILVHFAPNFFCSIPSALSQHISYISRLHIFF